MADITGLFGKVTIWCLNHDEPEEMTLLQNTEQIKTPFYACNNNGCANRMNIDDYSGMVLKFMELAEKEGYPAVDLTNFSFAYRGVRHKFQCKILMFNKKEIRIGILNKTVLGV